MCNLVLYLQMEIRKEIHTAIELLYVAPFVFDSSDKVGEHKQLFFLCWIHKDRYPNL